MSKQATKHKDASEKILQLHRGSKFRRQCSNKVFPERRHRHLESPDLSTGKLPQQRRQSVCCRQQRRELWKDEMRKSRRTRQGQRFHKKICFAPPPKQIAKDFRP